MKTTLLYCLALCAGLIAASPGLAQTPQTQAAPTDAGTGQPVEPDTLILSDTLHYDDLKRESIFTGNVILTRGPMTLRADRLVTHEDADGNQYGTATSAKSGLVHIRQDNPEKFEVIKASGLKANYDGKTGEVEVIGQAIVTRYICGKALDNIRGERVIYHQNTGTYEAFGGAGSAAPDGRVRSLAQPRSKADRAMAECTKNQAKP